MDSPAATALPLMLATWITVPGLNDVGMFVPYRLTQGVHTRRSRMVFAGEGDGGDYVVVVPRKDYADGDLTVVGSVGGVQGASAVVETDFAAGI